MEQRTALVTGSSNGIGEAIVKRLAKLDYKLVVTGRCAEDIGRVASECKSLSPSGLKPLEVVADLNQEEDVDRLFALAMQHFGNRLHLLVNNAGYGEPVAHTDPEACYSSYKKVMQINLHAPVRLSLLAAAQLKQTALESGQTTSIINMGSIASKRPSQTLFAYATSKAALHTFSNSMAVELAPQVRVNNVSPGPIETKIIERSGFSLDAMKQMCSSRVPCGRIGSADEVASCVLFLADHQAAGFITGADLTIDGGTVMTPMVWEP